MRCTYTRILPDDVEREIIESDGQIGLAPRRSSATMSGGLRAERENLGHATIFDKENERVSVKRNYIYINARKHSAEREREKKTTAVDVKSMMIDIGRIRSSMPSRVDAWIEAADVERVSSTWLIRACGTNCSSTPK